MTYGHTVSPKQNTEYKTMKTSHLPSSFASNTRAVLATLALVATLLVQPALAAGPALVRSVVTPIDPGSTVQVSIIVNGLANTEAAQITEPIISGWSVTNISDGGTFAGDMIMWTFTSDPSGKVLTYDLSVPSNATGVTAVLSATSSLTVSGSPVNRDTLGDTIIQTTPVSGSPTASRSITTDKVIDRNGTITATVTVEIPNGTVLAAIDEIIPEGWTPTDAGGATFSAQTNTLRLLETNPTSPLTLTYTIQGPDMASTEEDLVTGQYNLKGQASIDQTMATVVGDQRGFVRGSQTLALILSGSVEVTDAESNAHNVNGDSQVDVADVVTLTNNGS
jgi:hypothetical protein